MAIIAKSNKQIAKIGNYCKKQKIAITVYIAKNGNTHFTSLGCACAVFKEQ